MNFSWWSVAVLVIGLVDTAVATAPQEEIARLYKQGLAGDKTAVEQCIEQLETVVKAEPQNQLARVYLGSAYTLRSRDMGFGPAKLTTLKQGLALMDAAVDAAPNNGRVRLVRALTTDSLPALFGRKKSTREDFERLAKTAAKSPELFSKVDLEVIRQHAQ